MNAWQRCAVVLFAIFALSSTVWAQGAAPISSSSCLACHGQKGFKGSNGQSLYVNPKQFHDSVHGTLTCQMCHADVTQFPHKLPVKKVACGTCHTSEAAGFDVSVHHLVMKSPSKPACLDCHGNPHDIVSVHDPRSPVYALNLPRTCGECHGNPKVAKKYGLPNVYALYMDSIHGFALTRDGLLVAATCTSCHGAHKILAPNNPHSKVYRTNIPVTCGACHAGIEAKYYKGIHGQGLRAGNTQVPVCTTCHTAHSIVRVRSRSFQLRTSAKCGSCHKSQLTTYRDTFHGQVTALGYVVTAQCWSCHRAHEVLPASDPQSSIAPANLQTTCGKCHGKVSKSFVSYDPHANSNNRTRYPGLFYTAHFMDFLMLAVFSFFGLHTILWFIRSMIGERKKGKHDEEAEGASD